MIFISPDKKAQIKEQDVEMKKLKSQLVVAYLPKQLNKITPTKKMLNDNNNLTLILNLNIL